ncbi:putative glycoside hydrolase [Aquisalinus flavus]|uniref:Glycoside-hydrolase family GH114 TIM-barrel domain-containing protein n=1 Tax=Aquisalinus flavus TaxID=1526572 RepID=A0A8J2V362_9PROT|nr:putative glycoside hydrolase [Aquisalinus flavus]MBD0425998.1 hypothetical protein [Aquisalinus flavus]UNE48410.1 hypothetical protein FF099_10295 [Aquisalinus flavus]GGD11532.1 hypothetical protein GCM10011342_20420 [Aquisalinus flavus]
MLSRFFLSAMMVASVAQAYFSGASAQPTFSWETVPLYAHLGDNDGLSEEEVAFLASNFHFVTLEKMHALDHYPDNESAARAEAARLKAVNPDLKVLYYWNFLLDYPGYKASADRGTEPKYFLHDTQGNLSLKSDKLRRYDVSSPDWQDWWIEAAAEMLATDEFDGIFVDALPQIALKAELASDMWGADKAAQIEAAINPALHKLRQKIGSDELVIYNGIRSVANGWDHGGLKYLEHTDGVIVEHFDLFQSTATEQVLQDIQRMIATGEQGKIVILKAFPGFTWLDDSIRDTPHEELYALARERIDYPLAAFLIIANEYSYFNYSWGYRAEHGNLDWYPEFDKPLGKPLGPAKRTGLTFRREYEHASVILDIDARSGQVRWRGSE